MLGTLVNTVSVVIGSLIGLLFKKGIPEKVQRAVMIGIGLCTVYLGFSGSLSGENPIIIILSMLLGAIVGTLLNIDGGINRLGSRLESKFRPNPDGSATIAQGFVTASLLFCVGAMTITGSLKSGLTGDNSVIYTKSVLDFVSSMMLASSLGVGVLISAAFVFVFQGAIVLLAGALAPILTTGAINELTCVGSLLILALGLNLIGITKLKVADYLPAIVFAPLLCQLWELIAPRIAAII